MFRKGGVCLLFVAVAHLIRAGVGKYMEGEIDTSENWVFLARFCFISLEGQFDYYIEYEDDQGPPNLLLYYDEPEQWPSVYKSNKTCHARETVLNPQQYQIVNLTTRYPWAVASGCIARPPQPTQRPPHYTVILPTLTTRKRPKTTTTTATPTSFDNYTSEVDLVTTPTSFEEATTTEVGGTTIDVSTKAPIKKRSAYNYNYAARGTRTIVCRHARGFKTSRERWWFIAVSNCNGSKGIHIKYKILMTNGLPGDYWHEHFSADEFYVLPVLMAFAVAYSFLLLANVICSIELRSRQLLHSTYKLFVMSVVVQFFGIVFKSMAYLKYAANGMGVPNLKRTGDMFSGLSETCFLLLVLLLAKGYTVTRGRLPLAASVKLTIFMCLYVVTYISLFIYEAKVFDPGEVLYTYESPAGYGLIILRILAWCMFIYSTVFTLKHYPEKSNFYYPFNVFGTLWFIAGPAFIVSANTYIDKWVRESVVCAVLLFITFGGHLMFLLLTMPSVANKNFPYHVRTTQIGVMEVTGNAGNSSIEQFGHHVYEPSGNMEQTVIIPLTRRTEEIFGGLYSQHVGVRNSQRCGDEFEQHGLRAGADIVMENVLSWSLAKNLATLENAHFDRVMHTDFDRSPPPEYVEDIEEDEKRKVPVTSDGDGPSRPDTTIPPQSDWVRDVPVELFTISKMVITKQTLPKQHQHDDSD